MNDPFDYYIQSLLLGEEEEEEDEELVEEEEVESEEEEEFFEFISRMFFDIEEEEDILNRLLIERIENHNQEVVLRNPVHTCPYIGRQIVRNMLNSYYRNCLDNCRVMLDVFLKLCAIFR